MRVRARERERHRDYVLRPIPVNGVDGQGPDGSGQEPSVGAAHDGAGGRGRLSARPVHVIVLDGGWRQKGGELAWEGLGQLGTSDVGEVLERLIRRMGRHLRRCGLLRTFGDEAEPEGEGDPEGNSPGRSRARRLRPDLSG